MGIKQRENATYTAEEGLNVGQLDDGIRGK